MRRAELSSASEPLFQGLAAEVLTGYLGLLDAQGIPRVIALNFAALGHDIVFHGALAGEKFELLQHNPAVGFTIVKEYSYIPSHWSAPKFACPATQFFKSVEIKGTCGPLTDPAAKARALQALMNKYQPEGGYEAIDPKVPQYAKALDRVGVFQVRCAHWSGKVKFGQNEPAKLRRIFIARLRERGGATDEATAQEIEQTLRPTRG